ncbi:SOS response-associated peptidase [Clostridium thermarum]|uniref:SOS response-associated peptidase n=1 Tax=Clostridium thermarum TaxID=1716543 RepID=UPI0013CF4B23|nr:SOS response-associated peptidase [Clostridium thermarum]
MCGRFLFSFDVDEVMKSYKVSKNLCNDIEKGEKFPGTKIPVILNQDGNLVIKDIYWGIKYGSKNIINARFETVEEKPLFKGLLQSSRCIIPASSYYEWKVKGKSKEKMEISQIHNESMALAGIYGNFKDGEDNYYEAVVILTVPADESIEDIHPRMPLIISKELIKYWLDPSITNIDKQKILEANYGQSFSSKNCEGLQQMSFL